MNCQFFYAALLCVQGNAQLILCCLIPYLICTCPSPSWSHPPLGSSWWDMTSQKLCCLLVYVWQFLVTKQVWRMQSLQCEPLCHSRPQRVSVPLCPCGILLHQVECWAPPLLVLTASVFWVRILKPEVCAQICLDVKAMVQGVRV